MNSHDKQEAERSEDAEQVTRRKPYAPPAIAKEGTFEIVTLGTKPPSTPMMGC